MAPFPSLHPTYLSRVLFNGLVVQRFGFENGMLKAINSNLGSEGHQTICHQSAHQANPNSGNLEPPIPILLGCSNRTRAPSLSVPLYSSDGFSAELPLWRQHQLLLQGWGVEVSFGVLPGSLTLQTKKWIDKGVPQACQHWLWGSSWLQLLYVIEHYFYLPNYSTSYITCSTSVKRKFMACHSKITNNFKTATAEH